jgi:hypothetical protein
MLTREGILKFDAKQINTLDPHIYSGRRLGGIYVDSLHGMRGKSDYDIHHQCLLGGPYLRGSQIQESQHVSACFCRQYLG